ncbi:MAG: hypothetical protein ABIZ18_15745 [Caldimonas sp.]
MQHFDADIAGADSALDAGRSAEATSIAHNVLARAVASKDARAEAKALACLANCDRLLSRFRRSHYASRRAADLFAQVQDVAGEAAALGTCAHAASVLGRNEEAVEAGLLAVNLAQRIGEERPLAVAKIQLGVAYFFGRSFDRAQSTLDDAIFLSKTCSPELSPFQVRVTQGCAEVVRGITERCLEQPLTGGKRLHHILSVGSALLRGGQDDAIANGVRVSARALWHLIAATAHAWSGDLGQAMAELDTAEQWMNEFGVKTSLNAFAEMVRAEMDFAVSDFEGAERHSVAVVRLSTAAEHEQFAQIGCLMAGRALKAQGKFENALLMHQGLAIREQNVRVASLNEKEARSQATTRLALLPSVEGNRSRNASPTGLES